MYESNPYVAGVAAVSSLATSYVQAQAIRAQGEYQKEIARINHRFALIQAEDSIKRGETAASLIKKKTEIESGARRARTAAQGIQVDDGSAFDIERDAEEVATQEILTVRNNAWREAWGFTTQAALDMSGARMRSNGARTEANSTMVAGGFDALRYANAAYGGMKVPNRKTTTDNSSKIDGYSGSTTSEELGEWFNRNRFK